MNIKITNTSDAKSDALVVLKSADSFESLVSTMETIKMSIENSWSDCTAKTSAINNLTSSIDYYKNKIIRALNKLGTSVDAYALATEQLAANSVNGGGNNAGLSQLSQSETSYATPSEFADTTKATQKSSIPNFENKELWYDENPYSQTNAEGKNYIGQCTWFAWGRMKEMYGFDPGFGGKGWECTDQLVASHPDKFYKSDEPVAGALFSTEPFDPANDFGHTGIILSVDGDMITYQDGNQDTWTNSPEIAETDWQTKTVTIDEFKQEMGSMVDFANPYDDVEINW